MLAAPRALLAQPAKRVYRIATLDAAVESARLQSWQRFRKRLGEFGLLEGKNVIYEARYARGDSKRLPSLAAELVALKPDIIVTASTPAASAAMKATSSIPVVFIGSGDPVGAGLVGSLARPGGNATGTSVLSTEIAGKLLELLCELSPGATQFAYLADASNKASVLAFRRLQAHARSLGVAIQMLDGRRRTALERSFGTIKRDGIQGLIVGTTALLLEHRDPIVQFAAREKLPAVYGRREYVTAGGLLSYGGDNQFAYVRGAEYVNRILHGAKPAELPVEQTSGVRMVLNLKTARALGIVVPASVRLLTDEVIE
ncbi:MAG: ABC transporter substrate-binding protein [Pseudomonadota bacterium]